MHMYICKLVRQSSFISPPGGYGKGAYVRRPGIVPSSQVKGKSPRFENRRLNVSDTNGNANGRARNASEALHIPAGAHLRDITITQANQGSAHPLNGVVADYPANGAILQLQTGLFELGRNRARLGGATKPV